MFLHISIRIIHHSTGFFSEFFSSLSLYWPQATPFDLQTQFLACRHVGDIERAKKNFLTILGHIFWWFWHFEIFIFFYFEDSCSHQYHETVGSMFYHKPYSFLWQNIKIYLKILIPNLKYVRRPRKTRSNCQSK